MLARQGQSAPGVRVDDVGKTVAREARQDTVLSVMYCLLSDHTQFAPRYGVLHPAIDDVDYSDYADVHF